jgi:hypothetical protein
MTELEFHQPQRMQRGGAATVAARATAEYAEYAKAGRESLSISFPRIWRIPRFDPCGGCAPSQFFLAGEQIGLLHCREDREKQSLEKIDRITFPVRTRFLSSSLLCGLCDLCGYQLPDSG